MSGYGNKFREIEKVERRKQKLCRPEIIFIDPLIIPLSSFKYNIL